MKTVIQMLATAGLNYLMNQYFSWWTAPISAAIIATMIGFSKKTSFWAGFLGVGLLWMLSSTWLDIQTKSIISKKIMPLFNLTSTLPLFAISGLVGGTVGGLGGVTGFLLRKMIK